MTFVRNLWHAAGWSEEVGRALLPRTIAGEHVVMYRTEAGSLVVLSDTCPHRFAPMHKGKLVGDSVECGYHGLRFDADGACSHNPHGNGATPKAVCLKRFPAVERDTIVWVWLGDADQLDETAIPDFPWLNDGSYTFTDAHVMEMALAWDLIVDNLLDLSHAAYLHSATLGATAGTRDVTDVRKAGTRIFSDRLIPNSPPAFVFTATGAAEPNELVDYWANMRWDPPGSFYMDAGIVAAGGRKEEGRILSSVQIVTPSTSTSSYYLWKMFRNYRLDDAQVTAGIEAAVVQAFATEDEPMISAVQQRMAGREFWSMKPLMLASDSAAVQARRIIDELARVDSSDSAIPVQVLAAR